MQAPKIARDTAPFFWTYLDRPPNGTIFLTWQPLNFLGTSFASDGFIWPPQEQYFQHDAGNGVVCYHNTMPPCNYVTVTAIMAHQGVKHG